MIDSYEFGRITINGRRYTSDVIVYQDRVKDGWWRKEGHELHVEDVGEIVKEKPEVLIVGTGYSSCMRVPTETREYLKSMGVELIVEDTSNACRTYNRLLKLKKRVVAALHLTC
jgi:hypothetical protein